MRKISTFTAIFLLFLLSAASAFTTQVTEGGTHIIVDTNTADLNSLDANSLFPQTCTENYSQQFPCETGPYSISVDLFYGWQAVYKYVNCSTGEVINTGVLCDGGSVANSIESGSTARYELTHYACSSCDEDLPLQVCTSSECDSQDSYGNWEYYCSGNDQRTKRKYYNYSCGSNGCYLASSNYVNDQFVQTCAYGCTNGECDSAPAPTSCDNYCSGNVRYYNGYVSGNECVYQSENCNNSDGYACTNNTEEYRDYYCTPNSCNYTASTSKNCDEEDEYGAYQYYCSGNDRRKHQMFYNSSCSGNTCAQTSTTYINDDFDRTCEYGCTEGECNGCSGTLEVKATDWEDKPLTGAKVYVDAELRGETPSNGIIEIPTSDTECPVQHEVKVVAQGKDCGTRNAQISYAGDTTFVLFTCNVPKPNLKMNLNTGAEHYLGDNVALGVEVKDNENVPVDYADVGIWDPFKKTRVWKQTLSGLVEYLTNANATGYFTFTALATKSGYNKAYKKKQILVKGYGEIAVHAQTKSGEPIADADVKFNGSHVGFTNSEGTFAMEAGEGTHTIEVCANGSCMSKTTQLSHEGDVDEITFELGGAGVQINIKNPNRYPIANVYVYLDGEYQALSNPFGMVYVKEVPYGAHTLRFDLNITNEDYAGHYYGSKQIEVDEALEIVDVTITMTGSGISIASIDEETVLVSQSDANMHAQVAPLVIAAAVVDVVSVTMSTEEWCKCAYKENIDNFEGGLAACRSAIESCSGDIRNCIDTIYVKGGTTAVDCAFEEAMLIGDAASPFIPVGIFGHAAVWVGKSTRVVGKASKIVKIAKASKIWKYVDNGVGYFVNWKDDIKSFGRTIVRLPADKLDSAVKRFWDELSTNTETLLKNTSPSDVPSNHLTNSGNIQGWLGEEAQYLYVEAIAKGFKEKGRKVVAAAGEPDELFAETPAFYFRFNQNGRSLIVKKKGVSGIYSEIDGLIFVDGKPVVLETKIKSGRDIATDLPNEDLFYDKKLKPVQELFENNNPEIKNRLYSSERNPSFRLLGPKGEVIGNESIRVFIDKLKLRKDVPEASVGEFPASLKEFSDAAYTIWRTADN